jgi:hypothetical protein
LRRLGGLAYEPFGVGVIGSVQDDGPGVADVAGAAVVDVGGGVQADPGMAMIVVVPGEE